MTSNHLCVWGQQDGLVVKASSITMITDEITPDSHGTKVLLPRKTIGRVGVEITSPCNYGRQPQMLDRQHDGRVVKAPSLTMRTDLIYAG